MRDETRSAYTVLELLVVLGIVGLLLGVLLPAVQQARAAARAAGCLNNARQLGLATLAFHDLHGYLPTEPLLSRQAPGWAIDLLPHLGQAALRQRFDVEQPVDADVNALAASASRPPSYRCPENLDRPLSVLTPGGLDLQVYANHYVLNSAVLGRSLAAFPQTDTSLLARDAGSAAGFWHASPFVSVLSDGSAPPHPAGTVAVYLSGRAEMCPRTTSGQ